MNETIIFDKNIYVSSTYTIVGPKEKQSRIGKLFDMKLNDDKFNESTYEKAESKMLSYAVNRVIKKAGLSREEINLIISGDLLNQIISASFMARDFDIPFLGVYSACSTITESLIIAGNFLNSTHFSNIVCATSSHFATAERQYRYPLELGAIRPPQSQWTVTGAGAFLLSKSLKTNVLLTCSTIGKIVDFGVVDVNNMGAAMAPAACKTLISHFKNTKTKPSDYDLIVTGDLGSLGSRLLKIIIKEGGYNIDSNHVDCGELIYNIDEDNFQGGSGAGCGAIVMGSYIYPKLLNRELKKVLFLATGALLSTVSSQQGESIPCISHAVVLESKND